MNPQPNPRLAEAQAQRTIRHLEMLEELAAMALTLARAAAVKAQRHLDNPAPEPGPDPVLAFTRLSTTVRQVIALEAAIAAPANTRRQATRHIEERLDADEATALINKSAGVSEIIATIRGRPASQDLDQHPGENPRPVELDRLPYRRPDDLRPLPMACDRTKSQVVSTDDPNQVVADLIQPSEVRPRARDPT